MAQLNFDPEPKTQDEVRESLLRDMFSSRDRWEYVRHSLDRQVGLLSQYDSAFSALAEPDASAYAHAVSGIFQRIHSLECQMTSGVDVEKMVVDLSYVQCATEKIRDVHENLVRSFASDFR